MTENKLYNQSREEAISALKEKYGTIYLAKYRDEIALLTAQIYGMKLLDMANQREYFAKIEPIGTIKQLHDHLIEQFNNEKNE